MAEYVIVLSEAIEGKHGNKREMVSEENRERGRKREWKEEREGKERRKLA